MEPEETGEPHPASWERLCSLWLQVRRVERQRADGILAEARKRLSRASTRDWSWFEEALADPQGKWFVAATFIRAPLPKRLRSRMLLAAVLERDPSFNRVFVTPCVRAFGAKWVLEQLLLYLERGSNAEKAGAANASYWVYENPRQEALEPIRAEFEEAALREFVANDDLDVRRCLIGILEFRPQAPDPRRRQLIEDAVAIATSHHDPYIRHRAEIQLGGSGPLMALPRD